MAEFWTSDEMAETVPQWEGRWKRRCWNSDACFVYLTLSLFAILDFAATDDQDVLERWLMEWLGD